MVIAAWMAATPTSAADKALLIELPDSRLRGLGEHGNDRGHLPGRPRAGGLWRRAARLQGLHRGPRPV